MENKSTEAGLSEASKPSDAYIQLGSYFPSFLQLDDEEEEEEVSALPG